MLNALIEQYRSARAVWEKQFEEDCKRAESSPEWDAYMDLSEEVLAFPCRSPDEWRQKAEFIAADPSLIDELKGATSERALKMFLASLRGPCAVLEMRIEEHDRTYAAWLATQRGEEDLSTDNDEYAAWDRAEAVLLGHQCYSAEEVQCKLKKLAECRTLREAAPHHFYDVVRSMILPAPAQPVDNGKN